MSDNPLTTISNQYDLMQMAEFMNDPELNQALEFIIKIIANPMMDGNKAPKYIVLCQAWAAKFSLQAAVYTTLKRDKAGTDNNYKKNIYYAAADNMDKIAAALKYLVK